MSTNTVNADQYIKDLPELVSVSDNTMIPVQEPSTTPESSTFFTKVSSVLSFFQRFLRPKIRDIEQKSSNWSIDSLESSKIFSITTQSPSSIQCTIPSNLPVGFEFEIEDLFGREIVFVLSGASELFKGGSIGANFVVSGSSSWTTFKIRKVTNTQWNIMSA